MNLCWNEMAQARGFDEALLLDEKGDVSECTSANIFIAQGGRVLTPPLTSGCLPGVTRDVLLRDIRVRGVSIEERELRLSDLEAADEVFITSTTRNLLPVSSVEGLQLKAGDTPVCRSLGEAFAAYVSAYAGARAGAARGTD